jgi:hypothetical protein
MEEQNFLTYGDLIILYMLPGSCSKQMDGSQQNSEIGTSGAILTTQGFMDENIYIHELPPQPKGQPFDLQSTLYMPRMRSAAFIVTPDLKYEFHKNYKSTMKYYRNLENNILTATREQKQELITLKESLGIQLGKLHERMKKEEQFNLSKIRDSEGKSVQYGDEIQLMHYDSKSFLNALSQVSETETIGYDCVLSKFFSSSMIFKILPKYRSRSQGDYIQLRDHVYFENVKHKAYLDFSPQMVTRIVFSQSESVNPFLCNHSLFSRADKRYNIFLSKEVENSFQIIMFRSHQIEKTSNIAGGTIVRIIHSESNSELTANICYDNEKEEQVHFRIYEGEFKQESSSLSSLWVLEHLGFENNGDRFSYQQTDMVSRISTTLRIRHFMSGKLLRFKQSGDATTMVLTNENEKSLEFEVEPVIKNSKFITDNQFYFMQEKNEKLFLKMNHRKILSRDTEKLMEVLASKDPDYLFFPLNEMDLSEKRYQACLGHEFSSEDAYVIKRISDHEKSDLLYMWSGVPTLKYAVNCFRTKNDEQISNVHSITLKFLKKLILFLFDKTSERNLDLLEIEEDPNPRKQKYFKDVGFIDILMDLLYLPFRGNLQDLKKIDMKSPLAEMMILVYTTLRYAVKEFRPNELYCSQWMGLMQEHSLLTGDFNDIKARKTFLELIDNNPRILDSRIQQETILTFVDFLTYKDRDSKIIDIIRAICICDGSPMVRNQTDVSKEILLNQQRKQELLIRIYKDFAQGISVNLNMKGYSAVALHMLQERSQEEDEGKVFSYFISSIQLYADLCRDRNYIAIDVLQTEYSFENCFEIVKNKANCLEIRKVFTELLINLWINVSPFQKVEFPAYIYFWEGPKEVLMSRIPQNALARYKHMIEYLFVYFEEMCQRGARDLDDLDENHQLDLAILDMTK